ncbi:MAG: cytochrome B6 [Prevotellaceae bacterium]|jgi:cytochrome c peroxidase|nr:cytochrome B6 [Prevotellaceae bacterium]
MRKIIWLLFLPVALFACSDNDDNSVELTPGEITAEKEELGRLIFFDTNLSSPTGQSCASCHAPETAFSDENHASTSPGAVQGLFGSRNSPSVTYALYIPQLSYDNENETYVGGQFWDGRSNTLAMQAEGPFLNPIEMGNPDTATIVAKLRNAEYYDRFVIIYGRNNTVGQDFHYMADAIAAFESTSIFKRFNSKYDEYLSGKATLTADEQKGLELFQNKGKCANCHPLTDDPVAGEPLFTDHTYDNLGVPKNPNNRYYTIPAAYNPEGADFVDLGLGVTVGDAAQNGKFRVQSLRNIAKTAPYGHNGYFATLKDIVHFYNVRDVDPGFPPSEYPETVNHDELGNLGLTAIEEDAIVAFLQTLTDK